MGFQTHVLASAGLLGIAVLLVGCNEEVDTERTSVASSTQAPASQEPKASSSPEAIVPEGTPNPLGLAPELSALLRSEMARLDQGMQRLHSAIVMGRAEMAADVAQRIHDSFILEQELTDEQRKELVGSVPEDFVRRDRAFHETAAELNEAVRTRRWDRTVELYGAMTEACVGCHRAHASARFPALEE